MKTLLTAALAAIFFLLPGCSSNKYQPKFYSREDYSFKKLPALYEKVPYIEGPQVQRFIVKLEKPVMPENFKQLGVVGRVICHPLIDENGKVEAVYVKKPLHPSLDEAAIEAVKESKFRTLAEVTGNKGKYSLAVPFDFYLVYERDLDYFFKHKNEKK